MLGKTKENILKEADYMITHDITIRELSEVFKRSKSSIHKDLSVHLKEINEEKYLKVQKILKKHLDIRHIKGGESTKQKYQKLK